MSTTTKAKKSTLAAPGVHGKRSIYSTNFVSNIFVREFGVRRGNIAICHPEVNALVPGAIETASKTPAFKNIAATNQE